MFESYITTYPDTPPQFRDCYGCERRECGAVELAPGEFFCCPVCQETLCPSHAGVTFSESLQQDVCGECFASGGPEAGR